MESRFKGVHMPQATFVMLLVITLILLGAVLKISTPVVLPFVISVMLTFVAEPLVALLHRKRIPRLGAILGLVIIFGAFVYGLGLVLYTSLGYLVDHYPRYESRILEIYRFLATVLDFTYDQDLDLVANLLGQQSVRNALQGWALALSEGVIGLLSNTLLVMVFTFMLLLEVGQFRHRFERAFEGDAADRIQSISSRIVVHVARYMSVKFVISLLTGLGVGTGFWLMGLDTALIWGMVAFILNFIPTIGSIAAGAGATVLALIQFWPEPGPVLGVLLVSFGVNFLLGNIMEPRIMGENLGLSPFIILLSLLAWGWLWGFTGLVLAVPLTVIARIICEHIPFLEPVGILMGSLKSVGPPPQGSPPRPGHARPGLQNSPDVPVSTHRHHPTLSRQPRPPSEPGPGGPPSLP